MSTGIVILRALRTLAASNTLKHVSSRLIPAAYQVPQRLYSTAEDSPGTVDYVIKHDPKDRTVQIPVETSIRYLKSRAYEQTYGKEPVWVPYRRNFKGQWVPRKTRLSCIVKGTLRTGNPCPLCRDQYLVLHETNVELLKQFISPYTGDVLPTETTNLCRRQHDNLWVAILKAREQGHLTFDVPFRRYNYKDFKPKQQQ